MKRARPLFVVSLGCAALTYVGCHREAIGNPKLPPDAGMEALPGDSGGDTMVGNPKPPPDASIDAPQDADRDGGSDGGQG